MSEKMKATSGKTKSIIGGMTVLGLAGVICKLVGVLFSIPLQWMIGLEGLGVYNAVFPTYNLLLTISSAGLPVAVSRLVARSLAKDDPRSAKKVFRTALLLLTVLGCIATIIILGGSGMLAQRVKIPESQLGFQLIAPCVALVCVLSSFRGFMQGQQNMTPTAISQLIEQVGKVGIALPLAHLGSVYGAKSGMSAAYGAAGALLGTTIAEAAALVYMLLLYLRNRSRFNALPQHAAEDETGGSVMKQLLAISIPITIGACIVPLSQWIDSAMLMDRLQAAGNAYDAAKQLYGLFTGTVIRIINIPTALALAVSMSLVPAISSAKALNDDETVRRQSDLGLRFAFLIGFPCSVGMSVLAEPIMRFFYENTMEEAYLITGGQLLAVSSMTIVLFTVVQATSSILQGLGKQRIPMYTLVAGVVCKVILNYVLVGIPGIGIHGAPIASLVCYTVSLVPNLYYVLKYGKVRFNLMGWLVRPGIAAAAMGLAVWLLRLILPSHRLLTLLEVAVGVAVYAAAALAIKAVTKEDLRAFRRRK
ncbi:MAG: polysaccharide biosynthesis protein [Clostridia bacterium]|nr:polysaccharide biosynthesis protein [Clostridia bacterium]